MLFNSGAFLQFFAAFLLLYWLVRNHLPARNLLIVAASYLFYGWWNWRLLGLLAFSSVFDYAVGRALGACSEPRRRKQILAASIVLNLVILGFFKYWNFFTASLAELLARWHVPFHTGTLDILLPVGISFYTFQSMSYAIDVYRRDIEPTRSLIHFLAFVSFFPQLVAGPIERASHLLPQFGRTVTITAAMVREGVWLALWGMFKKVVLADSIAPLVDMVFQSEEYTAPAVALATLAFGLQIYCDFSGYSDIARGTARVLGFDIMFNFNLPYFATSPREFWRRWHISLSTWLRDYLYISLGGNRRGPTRTALNLIVTMVLGGLWHGAAWNFVLWGLWHGGGLAARRLGTGRRESPGGVVRCAGWFATMLFVFYGWLLFRAGSLEQIADMTYAITVWEAPPWIGSYLLNLAAFGLPLFALEFCMYRKDDLLAPLQWPAWGRAVLQGLMLFAIALFWNREHVPFIYFQF